jgi:hypothetical protein
MPAIVVLDNEYASVGVIHEKRIVRHQFKKFIQGKDLREALTTGVELMKKHRCTKWYSDDRKNGPLSTADSEWCKTVWFPTALKAGWKTWAIVLPEMVIGQMNMQRFVDEYQKQGVETRVFSNPQQAMSWLESV